MGGVGDKKISHSHSHMAGVFTFRLLIENGHFVLGIETSRISTISNAKCDSIEVNTLVTLTVDHKLNKFNNFYKINPNFQPNK